VIAMTAQEVAAVVGGTLHDIPDPGLLVTAEASADSRELRPGGLFVCVLGERVDGHDFVDQALANGAVLVLASRPVGRPAVVVDDVVEALGRLATHVLGRLPDVTVVAVTGSSGKTSTKDLIAQVAAVVGPTVAAAGSFNTEIGLPVTVLRIDHGTRVLVLEMGARGLGHIAYLCTIAQPDIGVVLNVGSAHVGEFGSVEAIATAKGELVEALRPDGLAVLDIDDPVVAAMAARSRAPVVTVGRSPSADILANDVVMRAGGRPSFTLVTPEASAPVRLSLVGGHQVSNALAAAAVGRALGLDASRVAEVLSAAVPVSRWRMEVADRSDGVTVINDAYNANPESVRAALVALVDVAGERRSWAVLGEMRELGDGHADEHESVGRLVTTLGVDRLVVVGEGARPMLRGAGLGGSSRGAAVLVADADAAVDLLHREVSPGDVVLVKASRAVGLERVAAALLDGPDVPDPEARTGGGEA
jgi:UDP-N-acetylmuramoyl-tripeptide--D-alanyl-D-alanine ligase